MEVLERYEQRKIAKEKREFVELFGRVEWGMYETEKLTQQALLEELTLEELEYIDRLDFCLRKRPRMDEVTTGEQLKNGLWKIGECLRGLSAQ